MISYGMFCLFVFVLFEMFYPYVNKVQLHFDTIFFLHVEISVQSTLV